MQLSYGNKKILQIAIPSIVSNITVPLLGLIDVTIVGHLGSAAYIGAIAVGGMLFNIIYWIFGFLRMGTSGMTSQAYGRHDLNEVTRLLLRSVGVGLFIALILLALQYPIEKVAFTLIDTTDEVAQLSALYFRICIWGAPAVLGLYSFAGWFIGMQNSRFPMYIAITQNIVNIVASLCLVYGFNMKIEGVAIGTLTAQYAGLVMAYLLWIRYYGNLRKRIEWHSFFDRQAMYRFFKVNRDIFFRTICLVAVTVFFTSAGAAQGEVVLAVNTLLMQLFTLFSYIMDGFAYAGEALAGKYIGAGNRRELHQTVRRLFGWGIGLSLAFTLLLGTCHTFSRVFGIPARRHIHRRNSHPSHASRHDSGIGMLLPYLLRIQGYNGEPCTVDGIYHLLTTSRCVTRCVGEKNFRLLFFSAKAASQVIIDKTRSLQVSITNRRSKELKASFFHIPAHGIGLGRRHRNLT